MEMTWEMVQFEAIEEIEEEIEEEFEEEFREIE